MMYAFHTPGKVVFFSKAEGNLMGYPLYNNEYSVYAVEAILPLFILKDLFFFGFFKIVKGGYSIVSTVGSDLLLLVKKRIIVNMPVTMRIVSFTIVV